MLHNVFVYGTLKYGYGNNTLLRNSTFLRESRLEGFQLYRNYPSFPVAHYCDEGSYIHGELWQVDNDTLRRLDALEGEGYMYNRIHVYSECGHSCFVYVGNKNCWDFNHLDKCDKVGYNEYRWGK